MLTLSTRSRPLSSLLATLTPAKSRPNWSEWRGLTSRQTLTRLIQVANEERIQSMLLTLALRRERPVTEMAALLNGNELATEMAALMFEQASQRAAHIRAMPDKDRIPERAKLRASDDAVDKLTYHMTERKAN
jgi:hypothetical protein